MRSNQTEKNHFSGGRCGVVISRIATLPPGRTTRAISPIARGRSATLRTPKPTVAASKVASANGQLERVALDPLDRARRPWPTCAAASSSIGAEKSSPTTRPAGPTRRRSSSARSPVPQHTSSADAPGPTCGHVHRPRPPAMVQARRHDRVHRVVAPRDPVEHRSDLTLVCHARGRGAAHPVYLRAARYSTRALNFSGGREAYEGIGAVGLRRVRSIAGAGSFDPMWVRSGPSVALPASPNL